MKKILVCHTGEWIGVMVLLTPTSRAIKHSFPNSHLSMSLRPHVAGLMKVNPYVDNCILDYRQEGFFTTLFRFTNTVKYEKFHLCIVLHPTSYRNALIPFFARVPIRIGSNYRFRGIVLTSSCEFKSIIFEVIHYLSVLILLQALSPQISACTTTSNLEYWYTHDDRIAIKKHLQTEGVTNIEKEVSCRLCYKRIF